MAELQKKNDRHCKNSEPECCSQNGTICLQINNEFSCQKSSVNEGSALLSQQESAVLHKDPPHFAVKKNGPNAQSIQMEMNPDCNLFLHKMFIHHLNWGGSYQLKIICNIVFKKGY